MIQNLTESLPPYTHTPGVTPHPISDPRGHSYGHREVASPRFDPEQWFENEAFTQGIALFNRGYYWEAHEAWETAWNSVGRNGVSADFLKGLIKLAAAGVKAREGNSLGVQRHLQRAIELLESIRNQAHGTDEFAGQSLGALIVDISGIVASPPANQPLTDGSPLVFWPMRLIEGTGRTGRDDSAA